MEKYFQMLANEFQEKIDVFDDLEEEVESFSDSKKIENLKKKLEEKNNHLVIEVNYFK